MGQQMGQMGQMGQGKEGGSSCAFLQAGGCVCVGVCGWVCGLRLFAWCFYS
jgi:hypothetical protein